MKVKTLIVTLLVAASTVAQTPLQGDHKVRSYVKKDGTPVAPRWQTNPNKTQKDNYGSRGRFNPHTDKEGTKTPRR